MPGRTPHQDSQSQDPWKHMLKVLQLDEEQQEALTKGGIRNVNTFLSVGNQETFWELDTESLFKIGHRGDVANAWQWLHMNESMLDQHGEDWVLNNFTKSFIRDVSKKKRASEEAARDEEAREESRLYKKTKPNQAAASAFTADTSRRLAGVATLPPVVYPHLVPEQVKAWFTSKFEGAGDDEEQEEETGGHACVKKLVEAFCEHGTDHTLKLVHETRDKHSVERSVQKQQLDFIAKTLNGPMSTERVFRDGLDHKFGENRRSLANLGLSHGVATAGSWPDGYFHTGHIRNLPRTVPFVTTAILECMKSGASPHMGHGEGIANATAAAVEMARIGIPREDIVVPVITLTGSQMQAAAVYMLEPSLPAVCFVTKELSLSDEKEGTKSAKVIAALAQHAQQVQQYVTSIKLEPKPNITMKGSNAVYHFKLVKDFFWCSDEGLGPSFLRYLHKTSPLGNVEYACLPIAVRLGDDESPDAIVFKKLVGYNIGLPNDGNDRKSLVATIESVVQDMHGKGVIHMDLYLSNIMWKKNDDGSFSVRIIDFDAIHSLGDDLTTPALNQLAGGKVNGFLKLGKSASELHDNLYIDMIKENIDHEELRIKGVSEGEPESDEDVKKRLDDACTRLMQPILERI